jgi:hypothetical protein
MEWLVILAVITLYASSLILCYSDSIRNAWYYPLLSIAIGIIVSTMWVLGVRLADNKERIFFFSLCWEFSVIFIDYAIPLAFFGLNVNKYVILGSLLVATGLVIMKLNMR